MKGKKILIGITGSIAAYKIPLLIRLLKKEGSEVKVMVTPAAKDFVTPLTLSTLSDEAVIELPFDLQTGEWTSHIELGMWADAFIIAPATANTMAKMRTGIADNLLLATYLSARCPVFIAPAMDLDMYQHAATQDNIQSLQKIGCKILEPSSGELASGLIGEGRMQEPEELLSALKEHFKKKSHLENHRILITAGPTFEAIDPVRFIGNHSSGKMGVAIAEQLASYGAKITLVLGPSSLSTSHPNITTIKVTSATEMYQKSVNEFPHCSVAIMAAAVADYTPKNKADQKLKKVDKDLFIELERTKDIAAELGRQKSTNQVLIGFALETENEILNAQKKLENKNMNMIVLNSLNDEGAGFGFDTNKVRFLFKNKEILEFPLKSKTEVASDIADSLIKMIVK